MISFSIMSCLCPKDACCMSLMLHRSRSYPQSAALQHMLLGSVSISPEAMLSVMQFIYENLNNMYMFDLKTWGRVMVFWAELS